jgi:hypothetical protein
VANCINLYGMPVHSLTTHSQRGRRRGIGNCMIKGIGPTNDSSSTVSYDGAGIVS